MKKLKRKKYDPKYRSIKVFAKKTGLVNTTSGKTKNMRELLLIKKIVQAFGTPANTAVVKQGEVMRVSVNN